LQKTLPRQVSQMATGVFHHLNQADLVMFHHQAIHFSHLIRGKGRDF
jgi:hypothetical protein